MIRRPPRSTRTDTLFPTRRSSDLRAGYAYDLEKAKLLLAESSYDGQTISYRLIPNYYIYNVEAAQIIQEMRSEEHTSELQSLMRISYAVFCLKKKKQNSICKTDHLHNQNN